MFLDKKTLLKICLNPGLNLTICRGTANEVGFSEGAKVAFPIVIKSYKLIGNSYKTKFVCSLFVGV